VPAETITDFNFLSPEVMSCPFHADRVAREQQPVYLLPGTNVYYVSNHALIRDALRRPGDFSNRFMDAIEGGIAEDEEVQAIISAGQGWPERDTLLTNDPPEHGRFRKLVNSAFSKKRVDILAPSIERDVEALIDDFIDQGSCDFVTAFAAPMPLRVIAKLLSFGDDQTDLLKHWSDAFSDRLSGVVARDRFLDCTRIILQYQHHMSAKIDHCREHPEDSMLSDLVHAKVGGERSLDKSELLTICHELLVAGNETTANTLSGGMLLLLTHSEELRKVRDNPQLIPNMVEEMLRCTSPAQAMPRVVTRDTELGGVSIPAGSQLMLRYISANRDGAIFDQPERFCIDRSDADRHLSFGQGGKHVCIGLMLARRELAIAFERLLARLADLRLEIAEADVEYPPNMLLRGVKSLPISFTRTP